MKPSILMPGLYFLDADLIPKEKSENVPLKRGATKTEAMDALISALQDNDPALAREAMDFIGKPSLSLPGTVKNITKILAGITTLSYDILDDLERNGAIDRALLLSEMKKDKRIEWVGWLLKDRNSIKKTEDNLSADYMRKIHGGSFRKSATMLLERFIRSGCAAQAADLDIPFIIRGLVQRSQHEGANLFLSAISGNSNSVEDIAKLSEVLWDPATYALVNPNLNEYEIDNDLVKNCSLIVRQILSDDDLDLRTARRLERIVELSPRLASAMERYWLLPDDVITANHAGKWSPTDQESITERLPGIDPPHHKDLLDCAIRVGAPWVEHAFLAGGKLHDAILERLKDDKGPLMAGFILGLRPDEIHSYIPKLIKLFGPSWKDGQGRGIGHYLVRVSNSPTETMLKAILRTSAGVGALAQIDGEKTALSFLEQHDEWQTNKRKLDLLKKARHRVLDHISKRVAISRPNLSKPYF